MAGDFESRRDSPSAGSEDSEETSTRLFSSRALDPARMITVVSGLPRSGTSMMMQMLGVAGLEISTDGIRAGDEDNPNGYFELEAVKRIRVDVGFLREQVGRVVKIVAPLVPFLPNDYEYRVLFMERDIDEILASQRTMLGRHEEWEEARAEDEALAHAYSRTLDRVECWLADQPNTTTIFIPHRLSVEAPNQAAEWVAKFLVETGGLPEGAFDSRLAAMADVVDAGLHRHRIDVA